MIFSSACCTFSPEVPRASPSRAFSLSISSMKTIPACAFATVAVRLVDEPLQDRLEFLVHVARLRERGGLGGDERHAQSCARVSHNSVLPLPEGPTKGCCS